MLQNDPGILKNSKSSGVVIHEPRKYTSSLGRLHSFVLEVLSMMRKTFTTAVLAAGATLALAPAAHADDVDPAKFAERTVEFVNYADPAVLNAAAEGKQVIVSPYGTAHTIACRGNGTSVPLYDCMQQDDLGWITLRRMDLPGIGPAWVYVP